MFTGGKLFDYLFIFDVWVPPVYLAIYFPTIYLVLIFFFLLWGWRSDGIRGKEVIMGGGFGVWFCMAFLVFTSGRVDSGQAQ